MFDGVSEHLNEKLESTTISNREKLVVKLLQEFVINVREKFLQQRIEGNL